MKSLLITIGILSLFFLLRFNNLPPQIPLFYSRVEGEDQLADWWFIFLIPFAIIFFYFLNIYIQEKFFKDDNLVKKFTYILNLSVEIILSLIFLRILFLIT